MGSFSTERQGESWSHTFSFDDGFGDQGFWFLWGRGILVSLAPWGRVGLRARRAGEGQRKTSALRPLLRPSIWSVTLPPAGLVISVQSGALLVGLPM